MSGDSITTHHQTCHCGHDVCSHFDKTYSCLCSGCDCRAYVNEHDRKPVAALPPRPNHASHCRCSRCRLYV